MSRMYVNSKHILYWVFVAFALLIILILMKWDSRSTLCYRPLRFLMSLERCETSKEIKAVIDAIKGKKVSSKTSETRAKMKVSSETSKEMKLALDDILSMTPPKFLDNYQNPCWKDGEKLRCLPYVMMIGLDKCATTDLFNRITKHPDLLNNTGDLGKEPLWWAWRRYGYGYYWFKDKPMESFERYLQYFDKATAAVEDFKTDKGFHPRITIDGSVVDFYDFSGWPQIHQNKGLKEPKVLTPNLIYHINPKTKFLLMLREPVERLYSDYFYWSSVRGIKELTKEVFHEQVVRSIKVLKDCQSKKSLTSCIYNRTFHLAADVRIFVGFYSLFLKEWLQVFPRQQFLVLRMEDYAKDRKTTIKKIFNFLDLSSLTDSEMETIAAGKPQYVTESKIKAGPMLESTRSLLRDIYKKYNAELANILFDNAFFWKDI